MERRPGTIWWDFDGTLVSRPLMWSAAARRLAGSAGIACGAHLPAAIAHALETGMPWHEPHRAHPELSTPELWWRQVFARYVDGFSQSGWAAAVHPAALTALRADILDAQSYSVFSDVVPALSRLSAEGWRHVIVSNHVPELEEIVAGLGIREFFTAVITSGRVGYEKPHRPIFEEAMRHSVPGEAVWMVGDNPECDCHPVAAFGAEAILVRADVPVFDRHAADLVEAARMISGS